jgi:hypothetical protein
MAPALDSAAACTEMTDMPRRCAGSPDDLEQLAILRNVRDRKPSPFFALSSMVS